MASEPSLASLSAAPEPAFPLPPDWDRISEEIHCPLCEYNLRGLIEPRCPECGYRFAWPEVLDPTKRLHPYLFEHHPERNLWSFWKTALGGLRPWRFWKSLSPVQRPIARRLLMYWCLCAAPVLACAGFVIWAHARYQAFSSIMLRNWMSAGLSRPENVRWAELDSSKYPSTQAYLDAVFPATSTTSEVYAAVRSPSLWILLCIVLGWPWYTVLALLVFRVSMRRARVSPRHVLRVAIYNADALVLLAVLLTLLTVHQLMVGGPTPGGMMFLASLGVFLFLGFLAQYFMRLWLAYRWYMRFHHAFATVFASQVIVCLVGLNLFLLMIFWL